MIILISITIVESSIIRWPSCSPEFDCSTPLCPPGPKSHHLHHHHHHYHHHHHHHHILHHHHLFVVFFSSFHKLFTTFLPMIKRQHQVIKVINLQNHLLISFLSLKISSYISIFPFKVNRLLRSVYWPAIVLLWYMWMWVIFAKCCYFFWQILTI